ncbi:MAG: N-6 DNA methylase [Sandaracinaceae bacterium]|nr:N-6 DNA methylase [Sandaracinaceae bacterium]
MTGAWEYPPAKKLERLLRETRVPIGVLLSRRALRLTYVPHGEAAGHIDFRFADMADVVGRPILDALVLLLGRDRLFGVAEDRQLHSLLARSRQMQAEVTTALSGQVFFALETLLRGFEAADARAGGEWLRPVLEQEGDRDVLFDALLTVLLRLVFLLYAEDSGLLPTENSRFSRAYSLYALYGRLEAERALHPDAMSRRFSAWPGLLALFRVVYLGGRHGDLELPPREGHLFDPHRFPFLEGFDADAAAVPLRGADASARAAASVPTVDDETVYLVLRSLVFLGGSRLSYRALQVEQIGSVYEGLMGWATLRVAAPSVRIKPSDSKHAPLWVSVEELMAVPRAQRAKWLKETAGLKGKRGEALAKDLAALEKAHDGQPLLDAVLARLETERVKGSDLAQPGRVVLQPGEERKRTSSHYTPPELSGPIVARALEPLLACFGETASSDQILSLKICDPAMGSGAFLVEACRYLAERLTEAWAREGVTTTLFSAEDDLTTYARRQIAERCLYGVDKNPVAVELAKLSLWLVTLQKDKPFTFLDHSLRCGDSLVGCSLDQITEFHWSPKPRAKKKQLDLFDRELSDSLSEALEARERIAEASRYDTADANRDMRLAMKDAEDALSRLRLIGDLLIGAFFAETKPKAREKERLRRKGLVEAWLLDQDAIGPPEELVTLADEARAKLRPFHWMLEFPEVFWAGRVDPLTGKAEEEPAYLDAVIGNPPFLTGGHVSGTYGPQYRDWILGLHLGAHGAADLSAHFLRRAAVLVGAHGTISLVTTDSIAHSDSRDSGLKALLSSGHTIYRAVPSAIWEGGGAKVAYAVIQLAVGAPSDRTGPRQLGDRVVASISSRLRAMVERDDPHALESNAGVLSMGTKITGSGFLLTPDERLQLIERHPELQRWTPPYVGGDEVNSHPEHLHCRYVVNLNGLSEDRARELPELFAILETRVQPEREASGRVSVPFWCFERGRPGLYARLTDMDRCLVLSQVSTHLVLAWQPAERVFAHTLYVFALASESAFACLQSRIHETWARLLSSTFGTYPAPALRYTSNCFESFPFPRRYADEPLNLTEIAGATLYNSRAAFMVETDRGLTKTYGILKDPTVTARSEHGDSIVRLRGLHVAMDRAVLEAYATESGDPSWTNVEIPSFTTPVTAAEKDLHQRFEDHVLDKLFELNAVRSRG